MLMAVVFALNTHAIASNADGSLNNELRKAIEKNVKYPGAAMSGDTRGMVRVEFEVNQAGKVVVKNINASHHELAAYVTGELEKLEIANRHATGTHFVKFNFKFIKE
jgi:hypothetical protein